MISDKLYFRLLAVSTIVLAISSGMLVAYFMIPRSPEPGMKSLVFPHLSSPSFKYHYPVPPESDSDEGWREKEISAETGEKMLKLLRGSKNLSVVYDEYYRKHPEKRNEFRHFYPDTVGMLDVYEDGSDTPTLNIDFQRSRQFIVTIRHDNLDFFVVRPERRAELDELTAVIQWGPTQKDER